MAFGLVSLHLLNIIAVLLCANHVTETFGKGITLKGHRLCGDDVLVDAERITRRPEISRANSSRIFRDDRDERKGLLEGVH